jgi:hypothetical protein
MDAMSVDDNAGEINMSSGHALALDGHRYEDSFQAYITLRHKQDNLGSVLCVVVAPA